jgi:putative DNA primase/helicase
LKAAANLPASVPAPSWLSEAAGLPAVEIIACTNGLLHIPTRKLLPHTPHFFTHVALPFAYDSSTLAPRELLSFLNSLWGPDADQIRVLQEIFGYCLTGDTSQQKIFLIIGPTRSGKGTIARVITVLLGRDNVAAPTLASLATNFGLAPLVGKQLSVIADARLSSRSDQQAIVERLLSISGEDSLSQEDLAYQANVNRSYMSTLERGAAYPGLEIIGKLATVLEVEPAELLKLPAKRKPRGR